MAKVVKKKGSKSSKKVSVSPFKIYWAKQNYYLLFLGIGLIVLGFYFMTLGGWQSTASLVISPILLIIGYLFVIPSSILYRPKVVEQNSKENEVAASKG